MEYFTAKSNAFGGKDEVFTSIAIAEAEILGVEESQQMVSVSVGFRSSAQFEHEIEVFLPSNATFLNGYGCFLIILLLSLKFSTVYGYKISFKKLYLAPGALFAM